MTCGFEMRGLFEREVLTPSPGGLATASVQGLKKGLDLPLFDSTLAFHHEACLCL
jgi:hypothetical protein